MEHLTTDIPKIDPVTPEEKERLNRSRKRVFWTIVAIDIALAALVLFEILDMFL